MGYFNPYLHYGLTEFVRDAARAGVDGLIVPDLPTEEAGPFQEMCDDNNLYLIPLLAPTSTDERIAQACKPARGFIYCVSVTGVTGARSSLRQGLAELVRRIRLHTDLPVLVGFGVSSREHVEEIGQFADGAIVASALLDAIDKAPREMAVRTAGDFLKGLRS
jgi:tryptophan synthase alpha chain